MNSVWWQTNEVAEILAVNDVVSMADANLYTSKNTGKNRVTGEIKKL